MARKVRQTVKVGGRAAKSLTTQTAVNKKPRDKTPAGGGPMSVFSARDAIKYRKYQNQMALRNKSNPLSKEQWLKAGRPK